MKDIQVITGCMFAGKTTELINRTKSIGGQYLLVKPKIDTRDLNNQISTHDGLVEEVVQVNRLSEIFQMVKNTKVVGIDEAQFFTKEIIEDILHLSSKNIIIIIAGLEKDYLNQTFGFMKEIIEISTSTTFLKAKCNECGNPATQSYRKSLNFDSQVLIGNENEYEALCKKCFQKRI